MISEAVAGDMSLAVRASYAGKWTFSRSIKVTVSRCLKDHKRLMESG